MPKKLPDNVDYNRSKDMFKVAIEGIVTCLKEEKNMRFDLCMGLLVIIAGLIFQVSMIEWCLLILLIGLVLMAEMINTAIENIVDFICPHYDLRAKKIKDIACGAVLVICIASAIIGLLIFVPYLF